MKTLKSLLGTCLPLLLAVGCGGSSGPGNNSNVVVSITQTNSKQDLTSYELFLTNAGNTTLDETQTDTFASTQNEPIWIDNYGSKKSSKSLEISFRTLGVNAPYYVFVKVPKSTNTTESLSLTISVDGVSKPAKLYSLAQSATTQLPKVQIDRNEAKY